jgi:DNA modification methylase
MGSGSLLLAVKRHGGKAIGIEMEEKYCEAAVERLSQTNIELEGDAA